MIYCDIARKPQVKKVNQQIVFFHEDTLRQVTERLAGNCAGGFKGSACCLEH